MPSYSSEHIRKGGLRLLIPSSLLEWNIPCWMKAAPKQGDHTVESKKTWCRPLDRHIGPLSLGLYSQVGTTLLKCDFNTPAFHEVDDNGKARMILICGEVGSCIAFSLEITSQHPSNGQRRLSSTIPESCSATPFDLLFALPIPLDPGFVPGGKRINEYLIKLG